MNFIFSYRIDRSSVTFFSEAKKLHFIKTTIKALSWRCIPLLGPIITECVANIGNPYNQIREIVSSSLRIILGVLWHPSFVSVAVMKSKISSGLFRESYSSSFVGLSSLISNEISSAKNQSVDGKEAMAGFVNCCRTIVGVLGAFYVSRSNPGYDIFILSNLEFMLETISVEDVEYKKLLDTSLIKIACISYNASQVTELSQRLVAFMHAKNQDWITQVNVLPLLQFLAFRNMFSLPVSSFRAIFDYVNDLMIHSIVEVIINLINLIFIYC